MIGLTSLFELNFEEKIASFSQVTCKYQVPEINKTTLILQSD
jgi:hypothetical protein